MLLSLGISAFVSIFAVRSLHEFLELFLKAHVIGRRRQFTHHGRIRLRRGCRGSRRLLHRIRLFLFNRLFQGKINLPLIVDLKDFDLDDLPDLKMVMDVFHKGICNFGNMNQTAFAAGKRDKCAKAHNTGYFTLLNTANF